MSYADQIFIENCKDILENGTWDTDLPVRPHWEDGTPAHTIKKFGMVNRYDLSREFPMMTLRRTAWKSAAGADRRCLRCVSLRRSLPGIRWKADFCLAG